MQNLKILFDFSKKYIPADSIKSMDDAFYHAIDITIDGLLERYEEYENTHPNNLISRDINFSIPIANGKNTMERLTKTIAAVRRGKQSTKPEIAEIFNGWKSIDFEVLMDKSDSYARTVIFRTVNLKRPKTIFAHEALNIFTGVKGFISYKEYKLVNDAFIPIFNELIEAADSDATGNSPELSYLLKMLSWHEDFNGDFIKYRNVFSWLHHWFDKYHVNLNAQREETMLSDLDENLDDGLSSHHNIFDASKRDNWIYDDMMLLISQIILHEIVRGHDFIEEWDDETGKHHTAVGELERHFEAERMIPGTPEYKEWVDPYEMIEEVALSMNEIGIKVDKNMINKYIMRKRRRRRR